MCSKKMLLVACLGLLLGGSCPTTTTTFVAAMSMSNPDFDHLILRVSNTSQPFTTMSEERIAMDLYTYAFLNYSIGEQHFTFEEEKARYGEGKIASVQGKLIHISNAEDINDDYACTTNILGTRGTPTPPANTGWIALVRRGRCTFEEKVKNVYEKGAYGVIIYNDKPVMNLEKMQIKGKNRNITAVITYQDIGLDMAHRVDQGNDVYCIIKEGRSGMRPINTLNRTSVLFVSISFIVLMVISLVWLIFYYIQRFRYLQTKDQQSRQLCSVTKKAIMKIPTKTGKNCDDKDMDSDCCAICIEAYKASDCIRVLPCKHEFHKNCIDPWLIEHRTCPMCKLDVLKFYGYVVGDQIHTTPSPQHIPPNVAPLNDNDVPVLVVAIPHTAPQQSQQQSQQPQTEQGHLMQTSLLSSSSSTTSDASSSSPLEATREQQPNNNINCSSSSKSQRNQHNRNHSCSISNNNNQHHHQHNNRQSHHHHHNCCCANSNTNSHHNHINCNGPLLAASTNVGEQSGANYDLDHQSSPVSRSIDRRNSAPHVLQVSTASRQVTDV